jgi:hypothetical protein
MTALKLAGAAAIALTFGATVALAQPRIGDGSDFKPAPTTTPGYNVGTGAAHIGDGSNTKPISPTTPGYSDGSAAAQVGHHAGHGKHVKHVAAKKKSTEH